MPLIDTDTPFGQRVARRLRDERIGWLITVDRAGIPQPRPVWFLWDGETFLIFSKPGTHKLAHIQRRPEVAFHLDGDGLGGDIIICTGTARIEPDAPPADQIAAYVAKYQPGFDRLHMTAAQFAQAYAVALRITPTAFRGH